MKKHSKAYEAVKKAKKESVMGKLGDSPYEDPMEPWSAKYDAPIKKEEVEQVQEGVVDTVKKVWKAVSNFDNPTPKYDGSTRRRDMLKKRLDNKRKEKSVNESEEITEDSLLYRYIRSLGYSPERMPFATRSKYARTIAFKHYKQSHLTDTSSQPSQIVNPLQKEEVLDEAGTGLLMSYIKSKGIDPNTMDGNMKAAYSKSSEYKLFRNKRRTEGSAGGEGGADWSEEVEMKEEADTKDTVTMDIPLLIRVLEFTREDMKTDVELHHMVERLIGMRHDGPLTMDHYQEITTKLQTESFDASLDLSEMKKMSDTMDVDDRITRESKDGEADYGKDYQDMVSRVGEKAKKKPVDMASLAARMQASYKKDDEKKQVKEARWDSYQRDYHGSRSGFSRGHRQDDEYHTPDPTTRTHKISFNVSRESEPMHNRTVTITHSTKTPDEAKAMAKAHLEKKGYTIHEESDVCPVCGQTPCNCTHVVTEGIGGIEDSPLSATNSVKAMESRSKGMSKNARMIKAIYKKKGVKAENTYDWEKDDKGDTKPNARMVLTGGKTMTGKDRDTVEIDPILKTRPNQQNNKQ